MLFNILAQDLLSHAPFARPPQLPKLSTCSSNLLPLLCCTCILQPTTCAGPLLLLKTLSCSSTQMSTHRGRSLPLTPTMMVSEQEVPSRPFPTCTAAHVMLAGQCCLMYIWVLQPSAEAQLQQPAGEGKQECEEKQKGLMRQTELSAWTGPPGCHM
jgi:hypothetical protein